MMLTKDMTRYFRTYKYVIVRNLLDYLTAGLPKRMSESRNCIDLAYSIANNQLKLLRLLKRDDFSPGDKLELKMLQVQSGDKSIIDIKTGLQKVCITSTKEIVNYMFTLEMEVQI